MNCFSLIHIPPSVRSAVAGYRHIGMGFGTSFGFCLNKTRVQLRHSPSIATSEKPSNYSSKAEFNQLKSASSEIPVISDCFSQQEGDDDTLPEGSPSVAGGIVALGKFDALHIGHRELAIQAAKAGIPYLLSFVGMAEVFGWEPRAPIVAKCDRKRVLSLWAPYCGNIIPTEYEIEFSTVRHLTPRQFVEKLSKELGVRGVVAGENYRFGYRAAGDASELVRLCEEYEMDAFIIKSVMDHNQDSRILGSSDSKERGQVSSTRVRHALAMGDTEYVSELLGHHHRLILMVKDQGWFSSNQYRVSVRKSCILNLPPKQGLYENCSLFIGTYDFVPCKVTIDASHIHLELDDISTCRRIVSQDFRCVGIDFGTLAY